MNHELQSLLRKMGVCTDHLSRKFSELDPYFCSIFPELLLSANLVPDESNLPLDLDRTTRCHDRINAIFLDWAKNHCLDDKSEEYLALDTFRHAFLSYKCGGLSELYRSREPEGWYPKIIIREKLSFDDTINALPEVIDIYRVTSFEEWQSQAYEQSWSISKEVAYDFAFVHYRSHEAYQNQDRVIMYSRIRRNDIYLYDANGPEKEIILDERKLLLVPAEILVKKRLPPD